MHPVLPSVKLAEKLAEVKLPDSRFTDDIDGKEVRTGKLIGYSSAS